MNNSNEPSSQIIEFEDEYGNKSEDELADIIEMDGQEYALLYPIDDNADSDEQEAIVMRLVEDGENDYFEKIEDDEEFEKISAYIQELQETM